MDIMLLVTVCLLWMSFVLYWVERAFSPSKTVKLQPDPKVKFDSKTYVWTGKEWKDKHE